MRSATIKLIAVYSGAEQWSEHFSFSQTLALPRISRVRASVWRLLGGVVLHDTGNGLLCTRIEQSWLIRQLVLEKSDTEERLQEGVNKLNPLLPGVLVRVK